MVNYYDECFIAIIVRGIRTMLNRWKGWGVGGESAPSPMPGLSGKTNGRNLFNGSENTHRF